MGGVGRAIGSVAKPVMDLNRGIAGGMGKGGGPDPGMIAMLNDESGKPKYPGFTSMVNPSTGFLDEKYQLKNTLDTQALDELQKRALAEGPSKWAQLMGDKIGSESVLEKGRAASQSQGAVADAASRLAMRGGLSSGASERLGAQGIAQNLQAQQGIGAQEASQKLGVNIQDEMMKQQALAALPGLQAAKSQFGLGVDQYNIGNVLSQKQQEEMAKLADYQEQMKGYAAKKAGMATLMSGGGKKG